jgi:hypothetical protein
VSADPSPSPDDLATEAAIALRIEHWGADGTRSLTILRRIDWI